MSGSAVWLRGRNANRNTSAGMAYLVPKVESLFAVDDYSRLGQVKC